jgi:hypothetical protein
LVEIGHGRAVVAAIADTVAILVILTAVRLRRAVVDEVADAVFVPVYAFGAPARLIRTCCRRARARIAYVSDSVAVCVALCTVRVICTAITGVAEPITVAVELGTIRNARAVVVRVRDFVQIGVVDTTILAANILNAVRR